MSPRVDPAILHALSLEASTTTIASHGGSGFASTFRITTTTTPPKSFFVKTSPGSGAAIMFEGEHASLNAIYSAVPSLCPKSFAWGKMEQQSNSYFLATEFVDLSTRSHSRSSKSGHGPGGSGLFLAQKLAKLHTTPAPVPQANNNNNTPQFGFPVPTCCGDTPQPNPFTPSWPSFFAQNRLLFILARGETRNGGDPELRSLVEKAASTVVQRLLREGHLGGSQGITPVVVHGDLWSGNHSLGTFPDRPHQSEATEDIIYDPSSIYAHSEYELGIMRMFGGFNAEFMREYHELVPKTEPEAEYEDRVRLYECYHQLNHWAIFGGGGYRGGAVGLLRGLVVRYGVGG